MIRAKLFHVIAQLERGDIELPNIPRSRTSGGIRDYQQAISVALTIAGGIALVAVVYGGFKYVISQGNPQETAKARDTILYGLIGLAVVIFAATIVTFVLNRLT